MAPGGASSTAAIPEEERRFADRVLQQGLTTPDRVNECLEILGRLIQGGVRPAPTLGELLVARGYLSPAHCEATIRQSPVPAPSRPEPSASPDLPPEAASAEADPASVVGKYLRVARVGAGGMGEVWRAWDRELRRWVALKFLKGDTPEELARFEREAQTAAKLSHPNIAAVYEAGQHDGHAYIAMQLVGGKSLDRYPRQDRRILVQVVREAALAVQYAHEQGVVHRDLKPHNIMVEGDPSGSRSGSSASGLRTYVMDFGLAKQTSTNSSLSVSGTVLGTPAYMPPEQAEGRINQVDARSDVYALGATLYDLLTDRTPFEGSTPYDILRKVIEREPVPPRRLNARVDVDLETIVLKCLEKDPSRRYASARELADELGRTLEGEPIRARPASWAYRLRKRVVKNLALSATLAALVVLALTAGAIFSVIAVKRAREREGSQALRIRELEGAELCRRSLQDLKEAKSLWRIKVARRDEWEKLLRGAKEKALAAVNAVPEMAAAHATLGEVLEAEGKWTAAMEALDRAISLRPGLEEAWFRRGLCGLELYNEMVFNPRGREDPTKADPALRARAEPIRARAAADLKRYAELRGVREDAAPEVRMARAAFALAEGRFEEAERVCDGMIRDNPADERPWLLKAKAQIGQKGEAKALQTLNTLVTDVMPHCAAAYHLRAWGHSGSWDWKSAEADYGRVIELNPGSARAYANRAATRINQDDPRRALEDATRALELDPRLADAYLNRGFAKWGLDDMKGAEEDAAQALELDPQLSEAYCLRSRVRKDTKDWKGCVEDATRLIELNPEHMIAYITRGEARGGMDDWEGAIQDYALGLKVDPECAALYHRRGMARLNVEDPEGAVADFTQFIKREPQNGAGFRDRGFAREQLGDLKAAVGDYSRAAELNPKDEAVFRGRAHCLRDLGDLKGALEDYGRALALDPKEPDTFYGRGSTKQLQGDMEGAIQDFTRAIELDPNMPEPYEARGSLLMDRKSYAAALKDLKKAVSLAPKFAEELAPLIAECEKRLPPR